MVFAIGLLVGCGAPPPESQTESTEQPLRNIGNRFTRCTVDKSVFRGDDCKPVPGRWGKMDCSDGDGNIYYCDIHEDTCSTDCG